MDSEELICPGETIKELLEVYHYTQQDLANKLNMEFKTINEIINGKAPITIDTAIKLELIFNIDASFWNNLEFNYRKKLKEISEKELLEREYEEIKLVYKELVKRKLVNETKDKYEITENFKKFMEVTLVENIKNEYYQVACRKANTKEFNIINLMVWIQIGLKKSRDVQVSKYNKDKIISRIDEIRELTMLENQEIAREKIKSICSECGIIVNFEKSMPNTAIYGISRWLNSSTPFIQVSDRGKNVATFWFTFMHELGHIIKGRKKMCFLDMDGDEVQEDEEIQILKDVEELKADKFSRDSLIPEKEYKDFLKLVDKSNITSESIIEFAKKVKIAPCIVAGRLKFEFDRYNDKVLNSFNVKMEF